MFQPSGQIHAPRFRSAIGDLLVVASGNPYLSLYDSQHLGEGSVGWVRPDATRRHVSGSVTVIRPTRITIHLTGPFHRYGSEINGEWDEVVSA